MTFGELPARRRATLALATLLVACGCGGSAESERQPAPPTRDTDLVGRWSGELRQRDLAPFRVEATIRSLDPSARNSVRYSGIECSGRWTYRGREGRGFDFREVIDRGRGGECKGVGKVRLTPDRDDRLGYEFRGGGVASRGVLSRVR